MTVDNTLEEYFRVTRLYHQTKEDVWLTLLGQMSARAQEHPTVRKAATLQFARINTGRRRIDTS